MNLLKTSGFTSSLFLAVFIALAAHLSNQAQNPPPANPVPPQAPSAPAQAQTTPVAPETVLVPQHVKPLPGKLDKQLMLNSNSPEIVEQEGILLSTFPPDGKKVRQAHLDKTFNGRFDLFLHHIARSKNIDDGRTLYIGLLLGNAGAAPVKLRVLKAASYDSQPDAPFIKLEPVLENDEGNIYAGPGDRVTLDVLRDLRQEQFPETLIIPGGQSRLLLNLPIPVKSLTPRLNGRSALLRVKSNGPVYAATLAMYGPADAAGADRAPTLDEWRSLLETGGQAGFREQPATAPGATGVFRYGRVSGVACGTVWKSRVTDRAGRAPVLTIPSPQHELSFVLSTVDKKTLGTGQIQSAPLVVRYPDTAYQAHGNYGVFYDLTFPLYNPDSNTRYVSIAMRTAVREDKAGLLFYANPPERIFFRGTVKLEYTDEKRRKQVRYVHLAEKQGEQVKPLVSLALKGKEHNNVRIQFIYPPDATPPQVITIKTSEEPEGTNQLQSVE